MCKFRLLRRAIFGLPKTFYTCHNKMASEGGNRLSKALKAVLTNEQFTEYKANKKESKAEMKQRYKKRRG
jgi:hypothetical protein